MDDLLTEEDLPTGFRYPGAFVRLIARGIIYLQPWRIILGDELRVRHTGLAQRFPDMQVVPFAKRDDNDDVACFKTFEPGIVVVHDYMNPGWHVGESMSEFYDWLIMAVNDMIEFDRYEDE